MQRIRLLRWPGLPCLLLGALPLAAQPVADSTTPPAAPAQPTVADSTRRPPVADIAAPGDSTRLEADRLREQARLSDSMRQAARMNRSRMRPVPTGPTVGHPPSDAPAVTAPTTMESDSVYDEDKALEIRLKSDPEAARRYRSPRKAFFFSLLLPGAGQVYNGAYVKASLFLAAEAGIAIGWHQVAVVKSREKATQAREFAAQHWRQERYERRWASLFADTAGGSLVRNIASPNRAAYCQALYGEGENPVQSACADNPGSTEFGLHLLQFAQGGIRSSAAGAWNQQQVLDFRNANIKRLDAFEDLIGRNPEFLTGWEDNPDTTSLQTLEFYAKSVQEYQKDPTVVLVNPWGESAMRQTYLDLRRESDDLARTQKWFLTAMVINHLASAFDAALQANRMNRRLLHLETSWLEGLEVQGGLAWNGSVPVPTGRVGWAF